MPVVSKAVLKTYFQDGKEPDENKFIDLIDSLALLSDVYTVPWTPYSDSSDIVGWSSLPTKQIYYRKKGKLVFVWYRLSGTSDSQDMSFTLPFDNQADIVVYHKPARARDAGTFLNGTAYGALFVSGDLVRFFKDESSTGSTSWTDSGTKSIFGHFVYEEA